ncbi:cation:proton antiporter [Aspergillus homomorphus CBS 101889]|uniref:Sodium/hydrogen exchanger n=1 Tax=Aspergillus homomorphus (strain CBS 101889) TaxID=1450537 RepID=A0A395I8P6_ASPHC|nr:Sodium/hydrogen exchanger [Aspergillus homomorphus CBS 101889]RAL16335.1 Sodium/hydrogen exchanger [Aspergillus homomorphus CBS 101889]
MPSTETAFAYEEPAIGTILSQSGFLLVLNLVNVCLDKLLYCGLIGQLFVGILWGTPGAKWLPDDAETVIQQLGYLGLILLVYEGGLSTSLSSLRQNLFLSVAVALTGIGTPMALSFILLELVSATPLQAFAAGAALSATSLGTTFTILSTTGLVKTRLGVVTTSAAMLDDVVGLVMVQIITNLDSGNESFSAVTVVRPICVSLAFGVGVVLACRFGVKPILQVILSHEDRFHRAVKTVQFAFLAYTCLLFGLVAGATYAGTSSLFAAYLAGVATTWISDFLEQGSGSEHPGRLESTDEHELRSIDPSQDHASSQRGATSEQAAQVGVSQSGSTGLSSEEFPTGSLVYERYYAEPAKRILIPLFFASIGFAVPITEMFKGDIVWRGVIYAILMFFGKVVTGTWLVRFSLGPVSSLARSLTTFFAYVKLWCARSPQAKTAKAKNTKSKEEERRRKRSDTVTTNQSSSNKSSASNGNNSSEGNLTSSAAGIHQGQPEHTRSASSLPPKPKSLYPPSVLGLAMVARGEIGYLIASLAESKGIFGQGSTGGSSDTYLVVVWAISICTLLGPICVGTLVRRVKTLQHKRINSGGPDPLGVWGI